MFRLAPVSNNNEQRSPVAGHDTADIINDAHRELAEMAPSMLKKNVVALVFLPWLTRYTGRVMEAAKEDERRAILAELSNNRNAGEDSEWSAGYKAAMEKLHELIRARSDDLAAAHESDAPAPLA